MRRPLNTSQFLSDITLSERHLLNVLAHAVIISCLAILLSLFLPQILRMKTQPLATSDVVQCILLWCGRLLSNVVLLTPLQFAKCFCSSDSFTCPTVNSSVPHALHYCCVSCVCARCSWCIGAHVAVLHWSRLWWSSVSSWLLDWWQFSAIGSRAATFCWLIACTCSFIPAKL